MKKVFASIIFSITVVGFITLFHSCDNSSNDFKMTHEDSPILQLTKDDSTKISYLVGQMGFAKENIEVTDNKIIVEKDIIFDRNDFWNLYGPISSSSSSMQKVHYKQSYLVTKVTKITIVVGSSASTWLTAIQNAASAWNSLNGKITFSVISSNQSTSTGINVARTSFGSGYSNVIAQGSYVTSTGYPGSSLFINSDFSGTLTSSQKKMIMVHEIGHCIGFYHTDGYVGNIITNVSFSCRDNVDAGSVMKATVSAGWYGFSSCDKEAFLAMYPK